MVLHDTSALPSTSSALNSVFAKSLIGSGVSSDLACAEISKAGICSGDSADGDRYGDSLGLALGLVIGFLALFLSRAAMVAIICERNSSAVCSGITNADVVAWGQVVLPVVQLQTFKSSYGRCPPLS